MKKSVLKELAKTAESLPKSYTLVRYGVKYYQKQFVKMLETGMRKDVSDIQDVEEGVKALERWYDISIKYTCNIVDDNFVIDFIVPEIVHVREPKFVEVNHIQKLKSHFINSGASGVLMYIDWLESNNKKMLEIKEKFSTLPDIELVDRGKVYL